MALHPTPSPILKPVLRSVFQPVVRPILPQFQAGFTLIELLVSMAIGVLILGVGIAGYVDFNERQKVVSSARELETALQAGQVKAQAGDLGGCVELREYRVTFNTVADPVVVTLTPICADASSGTAKTYQLGKGVSLSLTGGISIIHFAVLQRGISFTPAATEVTFSFTSTAVSQPYSFTLAQGGDINDGTWE